MSHNAPSTGWPSFWAHGVTPPYWARAVAWLYCALMRFRRWCYQRGYCTTHTASCPVLVIGNRVVGGTGKTPVILGLVSLLTAQGLRVGIVSRGYGRKNQNQVRLVNMNDTAEQVGDEPLLLARQLTVPVVVAKQRVLAVKTLLQHHPDLDMIISDDGWQHLAMARHAVVELIDAQKGYGNGYCLPAGPLREASDQHTADLVLYQGKDVTLEPSAWYHIATKRYYPLNEQLSQFISSDYQISALAGIGNPDRFFSTLKNLDINIYNSTALADHQPIPPEHLKERDPFHLVIMTMKDAMRCPQNMPDQYWALVVETRFSPLAEAELLALAESVLVSTQKIYQ